MTTAIFWRFLWKEYRVMRAFWISMAVLAVLAQLSLVAFPGITHYAAAWTFSFALIFPALYAVACGATMFAAEKEDGTYEFLRSLPLTAWRLLSGKLAFAVASTVLLIGALLFTSDLLMKGRVVDGATQSRLWGILGLAAIEGLAWGTFFSLVLRRPLQAAILAIAVTSLAVEFVVRTIMPFRHWDDILPYVNAIPYRGAIAAVVLLIDAGLVSRWLSNPCSPRQRGFRWPRRAKVEISPASAQSSLPASRGAVVGRLVWQTWRQSRGMMLMLAVGGAVLALSPFEAVFQGEHYQADRVRMILIGATATLMGAYVFLADHEGRSLRFLGEQAVEARSIWVARQITWIGLLVGWTILVQALWFKLHGGPHFIAASREMGFWDDLQYYQFREAWRRLPPTALSVYLTVAGFACGQLASMFIRSGILAAFVGLTLAGVVYEWSKLVQMMEISWLWTLLPIPVVLLCATWLRAPDWILERNNWRGWLRIGVALLVPLTAILIAVPLYRIYQIPDAEAWFGFSAEKHFAPIEPTDAAKETADIYRRAADAMEWMDWEEWGKLSNARRQDWIDANERALDLFLQASQRPDCSSFDVHDDDRTFRKQMYRLVALLQRSASLLEDVGKLDEALARYFAALRFTDHLRQRSGSALWLEANSFEDDVYRDLPEWSARPGQSRERILAATKQLEELESKRPRPREALRSDFVRIRRIISGGPDAIAASGVEGYEASLALEWSLMPWERTRALRLLNNLISVDYDRLRVPGDYGAMYYDMKTRQLLTTFVLLPFYSPDRAELLKNSSTSMEARRRATHIIFAIQAWKLDHHGELPHSLDELVATYLDRVPRDPFTGIPFMYVREGLAPPPPLGPTRNDAWQSYRLPRKPFIWSAGEKVRISWEYLDRIAHRDSPRPETTAAGVAINPSDVTIRGDNGGTHWRSPQNEYDVWLSGEWFEIP